ncbi:MAG: DUF4926 domain-containing protein [Ignavibacterium sp.]|uniref:DUF4926 domain-containing protein n=1 Tax=Ignavibacterium sp. TaxID=2651167 RepID=UPI0021FA798D|nr:MAG: hypothetical protein KatS3mg037_2323 [Ignavibacterium sp.]
MEQFNLYDIIYLKEDISNPPFQKGTVGTVIYIYKSNRLFEVDFISKEGESLASVALENNQILKLTENKIPTIKEVTTFRIKI